jgi:acyl-CoA synthetase (AMP-forming)/AMP-acid ligase II
VWVRGPNVFPGYWEDATATAAVLTPDGWLRTGDIAVADDDGNLRLVDRQKDLVIVSGFNVYPAEVEGVLRQHPAVADAAVVGVPHPHTGEAVKAFVVLKPARRGQVSAEDVISWARGKMAAYKVPTRIAFEESLPKSATGKIQWRLLQEREAQEG